MKNIGVLFFSILVIVAIDQIFFYFGGHWRSHALFCSIKDCNNHPFVPNEEVGFLINPNKKNNLKKLSRSKEIPQHDDYQLNDYGFRIIKEYDSSKRRNVNVYGDSFTFGLFLREGEDIVSHLNNESRTCHFRNYGVPAFDFWQMIKVRHSKNLALHAEFHLFLFISDNMMRMTRPFEVHPIGRKTTTEDLLTFTKLYGEPPLVVLPLSLIRNSYFFQKLYSIMDRKWWWSVDNKKVLEFFKSREYDNTRFIHLPSSYEYHISSDGKATFQPMEGLIDYSTNGFINLQNPQDFFFKGDGHPNQKGAKLFAREILKKMKDICPEN